MLLQDLAVVVPIHPPAILAPAPPGKIPAGFGNGSLDVLTRHGCLHNLPYRVATRVLLNRPQHTVFQQELSAPSNSLLFTGRELANLISQLLSNVSFDLGLGMFAQEGSLESQSLRHSG